MILIKLICEKNGGTGRTRTADKGFADPQLDISSHDE